MTSPQLRSAAQNFRERYQGQVNPLTETLEKQTQERNSAIGSHHALTVQTRSSSEAEKLIRLGDIEGANKVLSGQAYTREAELDIRSTADLTKLA